MSTNFTQGSFPGVTREKSHPTMTSEITEQGNDDQALKGCAYQEGFFYNRAANGLRKFEPRAWRNGRLVGRLPFTVRRQGGLFF